jgi:hypothetical protein
MRTSLIVIAAAAALVLAAPTSSATPAPTTVWAKVKASWTAQARAKGQPITCENPRVYSGPGVPSGYWLQNPECEIATANPDWPVHATLGRRGYTKAYQCLYYVRVRSGNPRDGVHSNSLNFNVCKPGWLARLPRLR